MEALVSIIVPVYNCEPYLRQCLSGIAAQTYANIEVIVIDDGSTDGSDKIINEFVAADPRFKVIRQENKGVAAARNRGLDALTGSYLTMVDSDDIIEPDFVQSLLEILTANDADIAICSYDEFHFNLTQTHADSRRLSADEKLLTPNSSLLTLTRDEAIDEVFYQRGITHSPWGRLYKASLFDGLRYPEGMLYEDLAIALDLLSRCGTLVCCDLKLYHYRLRDNSIIGQFTRQRTDVLRITEQLEKKVAKEAPEHLPAVQSRRLSACFNMLLLCPKHDHSYDDVRDLCWKDIRRLRIACLKDPKVRIKNKLGCLASFIGKRLFLTLFHRIG